MHSDPTPPCGPDGIDGGDDGVSRNDWAAEGWYCEHGKYDPERACTNGWNQDHVTRPITGVGDGAIRGGDGVEWVCSECGKSPCACAVDGDRLWIGRARVWCDVEPVWLRPERVGVDAGGSSFTTNTPTQISEYLSWRVWGDPATGYPNDSTLTHPDNPPPATDHDNDPPAGSGERWPVSERIEPLGHRGLDRRGRVRDARRLGNGGTELPGRSRLHAADVAQLRWGIFRSERGASDSGGADDRGVAHRVAAMVRYAIGRLSRVVRG